MSITDCKVIELPKISDVRGNLTFIQSDHIPFVMRRIYYLYDVPGGSERGSHAHRRLHQFFVAMSGSFDVVLDDGINDVKRFHLNRPYYGLYVCSMTWRTLDNFSSGSVCMVVASAVYDEDDYLREYDAFKRLAEGGR